MITDNINESITASDQVEKDGKRFNNNMISISLMKIEKLSRIKILMSDLISDLYSRLGDNLCELSVLGLFCSKCFSYYIHNLKKIKQL